MLVCYFTGEGPYVSCELLCLAPSTVPGKQQMLNYHLKKEDNKGGRGGYRLPEGPTSTSINLGLTCAPGQFVPLLIAVITIFLLL